MADMGATGSDATNSGEWVVLVDPRWHPVNPSDSPPPPMMVGAWMLDEGILGPFEPNPHYMPADDDSPTDPIDAVLRLAAGGAEVGGEIVPTIREAVVEIGCDENDVPLVGCAPDGVACVAVVTATVHKQHVEADRWQPVLGVMLPRIVPPNVDIMLNPGSPAQFRLRTEVLTSG